MKLEQAKNKSVFFSFGTKEDSLSQIRSGKKNIECNGKSILLEDMVMAEQTHSDIIWNASDEDRGVGFLRENTVIEVVDGFVTNAKNLLLVIKTADCTPILCYATDRDVVGAVHSGREGTKNGIIINLLNKMVNDYACSIDKIVVMIGPAISAKNYEVDVDTYNDFIKETNIEQQFRHIDMKKVIMRDILNQGIIKENIYDMQLCTHDNEKYFSYRRDKTSERQISVIGVIDDSIL
jgi:YfiH family protein